MGVEQNRPIFTPGVANLAELLAYAKSQLATYWHPAAVAVPSTSAIIGFGHLIIVCIIFEHFFIIFKKYFFPLSAPFLAAFNSFKSCPDENVDPSPEIIITLTFLL